MVYGEYRGPPTRTWNFGFILCFSKEPSFPTLLLLNRIRNSSFNLDSGVRIIRGIHNRSLLIACFMDPSIRLFGATADNLADNTNFSPRCA